MATRKPGQATTPRSRNAAASKPPSVIRWSGLVAPSSIVLLLLTLGIMFSGLSVVISTHKNRVAFTQLQNLKEAENQLQVEWGQLVLEQSTFGLETNIQPRASAELNMELPDLSDIVMVSHRPSYSSSRTPSHQPSHEVSND